VHDDYIQEINKASILEENQFKELNKPERVMTPRLRSFKSLIIKKSSLSDPKTKLDEDSEKAVAWAASKVRWTSVGLIVLGLLEIVSSITHIQGAESVAYRTVGLPSGSWSDIDPLGGPSESGGYAQTMIDYTKLYHTLKAMAIFTILGSLITVIIGALGLRSVLKSVKAKSRDVIRLLLYKKIMIVMLLLVCMADIWENI